MKKAVLAAVGVILLSATGCGGAATKDAKDAEEAPKLTAAEKKVAANISKSFSTSAAGAMSTKEADCFATDFVGAVGLKELTSAKLITEAGELNPSGAQFNTDISGKFADAFLGCVQYQKRQAAEIAQADAKIDAKKLEACLDREMPESYVKKLIIASQTQPTDSAKLVEESTKKLTACKTGATSK